MNKEDLIIYLEHKLTSDKSDIFDSSDRLVSFSNVVEVVNELINGNKNKTYPPGYYQFK